MNTADVIEFAMENRNSTPRRFKEDFQDMFGEDIAKIEFLLDSWVIRLKNGKEFEVPCTGESK